MPGVIVLIDGEHHPSVVRDAIEGLAPVGAVWCGGEEKVPREVLEDPAAHYGIDFDPDEPREEALRRLAPDATAVVDLADEPVLAAGAKLRLASLALHLGLAYETASESFEPPRYERIDFGGRMLAVIGTGKRTGKTAVACHLAGVLRDARRRPAIVSMGRGGPPEPVVAPPDMTLENLEALAAGGRHAASDYLEDAVLARVPTVGCRRVGGSLAGVAVRDEHGGGRAAGGVARRRRHGHPRGIWRVRPAGRGRRDGLRRRRSRRRPRRARPVPAAARRPRARDARRCRTSSGELSAAPVVRVRLEPEPAEEIPAGARVAFFSTGAGEPAGLEPVVTSRNLARRAALEEDLARAEQERCDVYLTELKAAAIDTVAVHARRDRRARRVRAQPA